jgi:hypothetical protein
LVAFEQQKQTEKEKGSLTKDPIVLSEGSSLQTL